MMPAMRFCVVLSMSLLSASSAFAADPAAGFKKLIIRPIYDPTTKCPQRGQPFARERAHQRQ